MRILITGCNGLLGQRLIHLAPTQAEIMGIDLGEEPVALPPERYQRLDLGARKEVEACVRTFVPDWILNAAAYTNVNRAEVERELCWRANVTGVENLAIACRKYHCRLAHVSTDYIFDGQHGPYREEDLPHPIGYYGKSKLAAENILHGSEIPFAVARTMVLYGHARRVKPDFVSWMIDSLRQGRPVRIVTDQFGNTTFADELAEGIWRMVECEAQGFYHIAGTEIIDRFTFALKIAAVFDLDDRLIAPITTAELNQEAPRPMRSGLIVEKALRELGLELSDAKGGLVKLKQLLSAVD
ncbi:MAG TPA: NAD(P)-dependent oxidoreductase [bacterium]|nr:NAD(P)-dependent oxidoreductase [bacterium]HQG47365.1 NAD(P)-dependent oxidoreductase [bacterium]HQI48158.1 NAD(P)-dependent oxidoreductase [bacterium]HQJ65701.1 NAD(P)-dependent oxidoreductase [bacterium]